MKLSQILSLSVVVLFSNTSFALPAIYSVPMKDGTSVINATSAEFTRTAEGLAINFVLPEDLVGPKAEKLTLPLVSKTPAADGTSTLNFANDEASMSCKSEVSGLSCASKYVSSKSEVEDVKQFLRTKYAAQPAVMAAKIGVAVAFSTDPVGVLKVKCAHAGCKL